MKYLDLNKAAILKEDEQQSKDMTSCLVTVWEVERRLIVGIYPDREQPLRLYTGCPVVLRSKALFPREDAARNRIAEEDHNTDQWVAHVLPSAQRWRAHSVASYHAVLRNDVDEYTKRQMLDIATEEKIAVYPGISIYVRDRLLIGTLCLRDLC